MNYKTRSDLKRIKQRLKLIEERLKDTPSNKHPDISALKREVSILVVEEERKIDRIPDNLYFSKRTDKLLDSLGKLEDIETTFEDFDTVESADETVEVFSNIYKQIDIAIQ